MKNIQIFSRQTDRTILIVLGVMVLAVAPRLIVDSYTARKAAQEFKRMVEVKLVVMQKVEAYRQATGHYPDSIDVLSFTNSQQEIEMLPDLKKIRYRRTPSDYAVGWDGVYGYSR
jgi:type II secretory pathway pseudopilin PulG